MIGHIDVTPVSLKFWKQFDERISVKRYRKGSQGYKVLTDHVHDWANKIVLQLAKATPEDYVLVQCVDKVTGKPYGPRGMIRSLAAALGVIDAYNGLVPPNWGHPVPHSDHEFPPASPPIAHPPSVEEAEGQRSFFDVITFRYRYAGH